VRGGCLDAKVLLLKGVGKHAQINSLINNFDRGLRNVIIALHSHTGHELDPKGRSVLWHQFHLVCRR
jgi:hypothetical protein